MDRSADSRAESRDELQAVPSLTFPIHMSRAADLVSVLETAESLVIVCHDNPDPDCLASALALEAIALEQGVETVTIAYGGEISHQQNRAFVNMLDIALRTIEETEIDAVDCIAFVDHSQPGETTELSERVEPDIVVDHHPGEAVGARFEDIRSRYGATATLFVEYLEELDVELTSRLASALLFALHRERLDFVRDPTRREYEAALTVYPDADLETLEQLYGSAFSPGTLDAIGRAIASRTRRGSSLVASAGATAETDALPQAADYLLNLEGVDTVFVYGIVGDSIRLSARSIDPRIHIGRTLNDGFGELGSVGGHHDMAGGRIELGLFADDADDSEVLLEFAGDRLTRRFFDAVNLNDGR
ncbi:Kef-type K+ transport systems (NAD-bindingcomponent fused to domain related to exopolyphosphatase) [Natrarchaeobaculum sulfurireducens]|uniref:Kef-type K+ transport systems (NAD-bindingcomponent fused to domain related to exopolyphosphatase) n=2 Tax=Natrarchaeobaculum sulfurireducens TaxID=2044521 RepID=A0A346PRV6_9EURY|nr:Kef-type K+ transport systems (NAD-bindingcomponent fused to domain related to exopolyphosphatase) [Natrarchaeobaculum sulfurireducens]